MADTNTTPVGGSPWDEPLDAVEEKKKAAPSVVGDLDVNKPESVESAPDKSQAPLNVPTNIDEKVGIKVDAAKIVERPVQKPTVSAPSTVQQTPTTKKPEENNNFWQSLYGQSTPARTALEDGDNNVAKSVVPVASFSPASSPAQPVTQTVASDVVPIQRNSLPPEPAATPKPVASAIAPQPSQMPLRPNVQLNKVGQKTTPAPSVGGPANKMKLIIGAAVVGLILLFAGGIFLTEQGLMSFGLEKIYGMVRLETLWGGLPANAENAFAMSAVKMKSAGSYKVDGTANFTVNKGIKSDIVGPIVSASSLPVFARGDEEMGAKIMALAAVATNGDLNSLPNQKLLEDPSATEQQTTGSATQSTDQSTQLTTPTTTSATSTGISTVEEITSKISANFSGNISGVTFNLKSKKNPNSKIELVYAKNKIYLKTSDDIIFSKDSKGRWLAYDIKDLDNPSENLFSSNFSGSNFSITGKRQGSEVINGVRCYRYDGKVAIGSALEAFGLKENSVDNMDLSFWVGVKDHNIRKIETEIIPNNSSAITRIDLKIDFSNFGSDSGNYVVPASSIPATLGQAPTATTPINTGTASNLTPEKKRDAQRKTDLSIIAKGLEGYFTANSKYPVATKSEKIFATSGTIYSSLTPTYISTTPIDPSDPTYYYGYESDGKSYKLSAVLEDKTDSEGKVVGSINLYFLTSQ
jgi:hypothetical protein